MEIEDDYSYGVIPLMQEEGMWRVFLINQYGSTGDVYWTFPKGHAEEGESPVMTALRELHEETGLTVQQLNEEDVYTNNYTFKSGRKTINKVVHYYVGNVLASDFSVQKDEVESAGWFTFDEARSLLSFEQAKEILNALEARAEAGTL